VDKGIRLRDLRWARLDAYIGSVVAGLIAFLSSSPAARPSSRMESAWTRAKDAALALEPFAGPYATILFAFGLLNASIFSAAILPLSNRLCVCEAMGWRREWTAPRRKPPVLHDLHAMILVGSIPILLPQAPLVAIMFWSQTLTGSCCALVLLVMLKLVNDPGSWGAT